jgi:hypothetical protein
MATGVLFSDTSPSTITIGTGLKVFILRVRASDFTLGLGTRVRATAVTNSAVFVEGPLAAVSDNTLTIQVDTLAGGGLYTGFNLLATVDHGSGSSGPTGPTGPAGGAGVAGPTGPSGETGPAGPGGSGSSNIAAAWFLS